MLLSEMFNKYKREFYLENTVEMNKRFPETFFIPSQDDINESEAGDVVKLIFVLKAPKKVGCCSEKMWVRILNIHNGIFIGALDNEPCYLKSIKHGDIVAFRAENIACIW